MTAITSFATFTAGLAALSVTGVTRKFSNPPASLATADLPAMWPGLPQGNEPAWTFDGGGGWPELTCELIIAVEPVNQGTQAQNYAAMIAQLDYLCTALRAASLGRAKITWSVQANAQVQVADTVYWAIIATVSGR
jgi:hypothetical protein